MPGDQAALEKQLTGRSVLALVIGFFAIIILANGVFISLALSTHSGIISNEAYRVGLKYNETIAADDRQAKLGWKNNLFIDDAAKEVVLLLTDETGNALHGLTVNARLGRATTNRDDMVLALAETQPGRYSASARGLAAGSYIAGLEVSQSSASSHDVVFRVRRRLWIKP